MSTLRVNTLQNTSTTDGGISIDSSGHVTVDGVAYPSAGSLSGRNRIINGDMRIDQRNAGAGVNMSAVVYPVDRWVAFEDTDGAMTAQRSTTAPAGFANSIVCTTTTADASLAAAQYARVFQSLEGFNVADLMWGTANAQSISVSFWVRSSLTGTFGGSVANSAFNRSYPFTYAVSAANTWEYKTIVIPGDTAGTWLTDNGTGLQLNFSLGSGTTFSGTAGSWAGSGLLTATGATSVVGTNGATFYLTGVQLEVGTVATPFEHRSYGDELARCQRYYERVGNPGTGYNGRMIGGVPGDGDAAISLQYIVTKRDVPSVTNINFQYFNGAAWTAVSGFNSSGTYSGRAYVTSEASNRLTRGQFAASAEL
jgi:hypothetical protein